MTAELKWSIGRQSVGRTRLDLTPFRAYFYWIDDGQVVASADFSVSELQIEIERRKVGGEDTVPFEDALKQLK